MVLDTFTAANTSNGFFSYFDELINDKDINHVFLIKGGPGCGKSTFMKNVAKKYIQEGYDIERIFCSSDCKSLDGIKISDKGIVIIDATAPHAYDMRYPGVRHSIIDLSRFWDENKLYTNKKEITQLFDNISESYKVVYHLLKAAGAIEKWRSDMLSKHIDHEKISSYIKKMIKQNAVTPVNHIPRITNRMLSAIGSGGAYTLSETTDKLCDEYIIFDDNIGIAYHLLSKAASYFNKLGYDTFLVHSPLNPETVIEQVIIPQLRIGFIANGHIFSPEIKDEKIIKKVNTKVFVEKEFYKSNKNKLSFMKRIANELIAQAAEDIDKIKSRHDILESYYINAMDFEAMDKFTLEFINKY